ncbi:MAG: O-succinylhomoserine sulfhydrylase [Alphaproteobacteria bacterium]|nr:O-succinylhomoserine sulfhydrylase [Alphaproteobacteria bacterium]MBM4437120.1 O-succinylhomoserine sulfhydrylase [Actinomycetota bacterium]
MARHESGRNKRGSAAGWRPRTRMVHGGTTRSAYGETSEAMFLTSGYVYEAPEQAEARFKGEDHGYIYSRFGNPTVAMFEQRMCALEGAEAAWATATGMAAVNAALFCQLKSGDRVVAARALFGSNRYILDEILPRFGVKVTMVDGTDLIDWRRALKQRTQVVFLETPSNPGLEIVDLGAVAKLAHAAGAMVVVDNVFATPVLQRPLEMGADVVVYSATKHIDGHGRVLGGVVLGPKEFCDTKVMPFIRHTGPSLSPFNAWVLLKGLETLDLRVRAASETAAALADFLAEQHSVARVLYPGRKDHPQHALAMRQMEMGGTLISIDVGSKEAAFEMLRRLRLVVISNNLGDAKSMVTHPATTTHQRLAPEERAHLGITDGMVRLSVGLEDVEDLRKDLGRALAGLRAGARGRADSAAVVKSKAKTPARTGGRGALRGSGRRR